MTTSRRVVVVGSTEQAVHRTKTVCQEPGSCRSGDAQTFRHRAGAARARGRKRVRATWRAGEMFAAVWNYRYHIIYLLEVKRV